MSSNPNDLLPTDADLHSRESQFLEMIQTYEKASGKFVDCVDTELDNFIEGLPSPNDDSSDDEDLIRFVDNVKDKVQADDCIEVEDEDDYNGFAQVLSEGRKAIVERKRLWEETGDSFILDHCAEEKLVQDWVKQNLNDSASSNLDISTMYGNMCKERKLQFSFLEMTDGASKEKSVTPPPEPKPQSVHKTPQHQRPKLHTSKSDSTHSRRQTIASKQGLVEHRRRLSTVLESPKATIKGSPIRNPGRISECKMPRIRTIIYSPMQPIVENKFKEVLKKDWFDPNKMLVFEPPSDVDCSSDSGDDVFLTMKKRFGGKLYEI